jgi:rhodanese-related sulfurtransferase
MVTAMCRAPFDPELRRRLGGAFGAGLLVVCVETASSDAAEQDTIVRISHDPVDQQPRPFGFVALGECLLGAKPEILRAAAHQAVQHLEPGGRMAVGASLWPSLADLCDELGLTSEPDADGAETVVLRRNDRLTVHDLMWEARSQIRRVDPDELAVELAGTEPPLVIDTRTHTDRCRTGVIAGSIHVPRTVLEWHLDPANGYRHPAVTGFEHPLVVVCNGGYSSSLAAANLVRIGFRDVRDLAGGVRAWAHRGLALHPPDHAHLDL